MLKKLSVVVFIVCLVLAFSIEVFASSDFSLIYDPNQTPTEQLLVTITRPEGDELVFNKSSINSIISGNTNKANIRVNLLILDTENYVYEDFKTCDGKNTWDISSSGIFVKEFKLPKNGKNRIRVVAYNKYQKESLVWGENLQVNDFKITVLDRGLKDVIKNGLFRINEMLNQFFER